MTGSTAATLSVRGSQQTSCVCRKLAAFRHRGLSRRASRACRCCHCSRRRGGCCWSTPPESESVKVHTALHSHSHNESVKEKVQCTLHTTLQSQNSLKRNGRCCSTSPRGFSSCHTEVQLFSTGTSLPPLCRTCKRDLEEMEKKAPGPYLLDKFATLRRFFDSNRRYFPVLVH